VVISSNIENVVFWARSKKMGCAVNLWPGMMEYWIVGILGAAELDLYMDSTN
jgi:hypothetical protein